MRFYDS
jgi:hypothetical protein